MPENDLLQRISKRADEIKQEVIVLRRDFHAHPEVGMEEERTAAIVADYLEELGLEVRTQVGGTGVVGLLRGGAAAERSPTVALRADMDALSVEDKKDVEYASQVEGVAHACGHDAHTANLMGVAKILSELQDDLEGNVKFLFQPAEEGPGGAEPMLADGALENPTVDAVFGLHVAYNLPTGVIGLHSEYGNAASDGLGIKIIGSGGHGAAPHDTVDSIAVAGQVITSLQNIVSRQINPLDSAVISIGIVEGGYRANIIAPEVEMKGTVRTLKEETRQKMPERIERIVSNVCAAFGADYEIDYRFGYPAIWNDADAVEMVRLSAEEVVGEENVRDVEPTMGGEDFAYFAREAPGAFFRLGTGNPEKGTDYPGHHPMFDIDEDALPVGLKVMANLAHRYLQKA